LGQILRQQPGRGVLCVRVSTDEERAVADLDDYYVWWQGWQTVTYPKVYQKGDTKHLMRYAPIRGKGTVLVARCALVLRIVTSNLQIQKIMALTRTTNKTQLRNFGRAGAGTLRLVGVEIDQEVYGAEQDATFAFEFEPLTWNKATVTGQEEYRVQEVPVRDKEGKEIAGKTEPVGSWVRLEQTRNAKLYTPTDWSWLEKLVAW